MRLGSTPELGEIPACQQSLVPMQKESREDRSISPLQ